MSQHSTIKIVKLTNDAQSLASAIETSELDLTNFQSAKIVVNSGTSEKSETATVKIVAVLDDASEQEIKKEEIAVGKNAVSTIDLVADEIAHYESSKIKVKIDAIKDSTNTVGVLAVLTDARYTE